MMNDNLFLFPEILDTNPTSFLQTAIATNGRPFEIEGFKLFTFIECLDEVGFPFYVAPISYPNKTVKLYQYRFSGSLPDFEEIGLKLFPTKDGNVLYLSPEKFTELSSKYRSISIKSGHWPDVSSDYHQLAALSHLDIIPLLSHTYMRSPPPLSELMFQFRILYDTSDESPNALSTFYFDLCKMLHIFGFTKSDSTASMNPSSYYFGALRPALAEFHKKCFPNLIIGSCCVTPASYRQLRSMLQFVKDALNLFGYYPGTEMSTLVDSLKKFQKDHGLPIQDVCNEETIQKIWKELLAKKSDPISALSQVGVSVKLNSAIESEKFGPINSNLFDKNRNTYQNDSFKNDGNEAAKRIAQRLSDIIETLPSSGSNVVNTQKDLLSTARFTAEHFSGINEEIASLEGQIETVGYYADEVLAKAGNATQVADSSFNVISGLTQMNKVAIQKVEDASAEMERETKRMSKLIFIFFVFLMFFFIQKYYYQTLLNILSIFKHSAKSLHRTNSTKT